MSELSAISTFSAVSVAAGAAPPAAGAATGGPAFGAVLRESLGPAAGQQAAPADAGRAPFAASITTPLAAMPSGTAAQTLGQLVPQAAQQPAASATAVTISLPQSSEGSGQQVTAPVAQARQNPQETMAGNSALIAAAATPMLPVPVQQTTVATPQAAPEASNQTAPRTGGQAFGLPAGFSGTITHMGEGQRVVLGVPSPTPAMFAPMPSTQTASTAAPDLAPRSLTAAEGVAPLTGPQVTWTRGVPAYDLPRLEIGVNITPPPTRFTATQMIPTPVTQTPLAEEPEMAEEPEGLEEGEAIAAGFDALANASAEVGLPGDLITGPHTSGDVLPEPALTPDDVQVDGASARTPAAGPATTFRSTVRPSAQANTTGNVGTEAAQAARFEIETETGSEPEAADADGTDTPLPRAASAATASAYETASIAAAGRAADVTAASTRPDAEAVLRETARTSQPRTLAGAQAAQATSASAPVAGRIVDQVASGLSLAVHEGRTEAVLTLRPDALGEVRVQIVSGPEGVTIRLSAEREAVGELLRAGIADLQEALAGHQVAVSEVVVMQNTPTQATANAETPLWQERPWSRPEPEAEDGEQPEQGQPKDEPEDE